MSALVEWQPDKYSSLLANWNVIVEHSLDASLLRRSAADLCEALQARGLWDAARNHSPEREHLITLMQVRESF